MIDATVVRLIQTCAPERGIRAQHKLTAARLKAIILPSIVFSIALVTDRAARGPST